MKTLVLGDIHGRNSWKKIIEQEKPNKVIFLGDYVTTHECISSEQQIENLKEILDYKEANNDNVILLRGNHDIQMLGYHWARCSGYDPYVEKFMMSIKDRFLADTQWLYILDNIVFSHAGISEVWLKQSLGIKDVNDESLNNINSLEPSELFGFIPDRPIDYCGESITQSLTWIRPWCLAECAIPGYTQVVGHTPTSNPTCFKSTKHDDTIWQNDCMGNNKYIIINERLESYVGRLQD